MWKASLDGRRFTFHLAGINNQNFLMQDDETRSWWQQVSGECVVGPLRGRTLELAPYDELTFATWRREHPDGRVLRLDQHAAKSTWEAEIQKLDVVTPRQEQDAFEPRTTLIGIVQNGKAKAYALETVARERVIVDALGGVPLVLVLGDDGKSVRAFARAIDGRDAEFFARPDATPLVLVDSLSASEWDFTGRAIGGPMGGKQLARIPALTDFWFDWHQYHPDTETYPR